MRNAALRLILCLSIVSWTPIRATPVSPEAVGWGNLVVPGLGATLNGEPNRGLLDAGLELGLFFGATFGVREGNFTIDTTIVLPEHHSLLRPLIGEDLQQAGIKLHMYNTFYQYQQACLAMADSNRELLNPQPLYKGSWDDTLLAPFKWKNLSNPFVFGLIAAAAAFLIYDYKTSAPAPSTYRATPAEDTLYLTHNVLIEPLGSSFGEEALFRGFIQREMRLYTDSLVFSLLIQSSLFTLLHPSDAKVTAFAGGLYFGFLTDYHNGDIEPGVAAHFWVNVLNGLFAYLKFRISEGQSVPFSQPLGITVSLPVPF